MLRRHDRGGSAPTFHSSENNYKFAPALVAILLAGCASAANNKQVFDYKNSSESGLLPSRHLSRKTEPPGRRTSSSLLGSFNSGPDYLVEAAVTSNGRYNNYIFSTAQGTYPVVGDEIAKKHVQELIALAALKKYSPGEQFFAAAGTAAVSPIRGVITAVSNPVSAAKGAYSNVERRMKAVGRGLSDAGEYVKTLGKPEKKRPARENDSIFEKIVDRPKAKRRLATDLGVDPNTHYVPLSTELNRVASYSAAGAFGINRALGFVPGVAGTVISGLGTLDTLTDQTFDMAPDEIAGANRERLSKAKISPTAINQFLLTDQLTPTEKTQAVGFLTKLPDGPARETIVDYMGTSKSRASAYDGIRVAAYLSKQPNSLNSASAAEILEDIPVFTLDHGRKIAVFTADELFWTPENVAKFSRLANAFRAGQQEAPAKEIWISGKVTSLARRELQRQGWTVKANFINQW